MAEMWLLQRKTPQCRLEGIEGCVASWISKKVIPVSDGFREEWSGVCWSVSIWSVVPGFVASEFIVSWCFVISEVVFSFDVDQVVMNLVHHHQAAVESTILERWPFEGVHHICHATGAVVISHNESSSTTLDLSDLLNISLSVGIPSCGSKFNSWPNISVVSYFLHLLAAVAEIRERKALVPWAFLEIASTWVLKLSWLSRWTPRYLADFTTSKTWPWMV